LIIQTSILTGPDFCTIVRQNKSLSIGAAPLRVFYCMQVLPVIEKGAPLYKLPGVERSPDGKLQVQLHLK